MILATVKKLIKMMMMMMMMMMIKNGGAIFSIEYFFSIFGTRPIFKSLEEVWYPEYLMKGLLR